MKQILIKVAIGLVFAYFGWQLTDKGLSSPSAASLREDEKLCKSSIKTYGILDTVYTETTIKVLKGSSGTKMNNFKYTYKVNEQVYSGGFSVMGMPKKPIVDIWYDPANPASHTIAEPCKQFEEAKSQRAPGWYAYVGIPMLLIGVGLLYGLFKSGVRSLFGIKQPVKK